MVHNKCINISSYFTNRRIKATFSLKRFYSKTNDRIQFTKISGFDEKYLIVPKQTHSTNVEFILSPGSIDNCDGVFSKGYHNVCSIQVADCMPIFFSNSFDNIFGILHVGWRGLVNGIINNTASLLRDKEFNLKEFEIVIGPSILACCFEIRKDIIKHFDRRFVIQKSRHNYRVNLQKYALHDLVHKGFDGERIFLIEECTYCEKEKYYSYRRDGKLAKRMFGLIGFQ